MGGVNEPSMPPVRYFWGVNDLGGGRPGGSFFLMQRLVKGPWAATRAIPRRPLYSYGHYMVMAIIWLWPLYGYDHHIVMAII